MKARAHTPARHTLVHAVCQVIKAAFKRVAQRSAKAHNTSHTSAAL